MEKKYDVNVGLDPIEFQMFKILSIQIGIFEQKEKYEEEEEKKRSKKHNCNNRMAIRH